MHGKRAGLLVSWLDQAIADAAMLGALADGVIPALLVCR